LVGQGIFAVSRYPPAGPTNRYVNHFNAVTAIVTWTPRRTTLSKREDIEVKLGRIRDRSGAGRKPDTFIGEVMRAAKKAGHVGNRFGRATDHSHGSRFGRGRGAALSLSRYSRSRQVLTKVRVVRHMGRGFRSAALARHVTYLKRDGVTYDGADARMFDARSDDANGRAFAERCRDDRHHFRFIVSPEDAAKLENLRTFTRELMADAERDLGSRLDWIAVDHWNTDNPHIHILVRGRADDGKDLVISRAYISQGFRHRAAERVMLELGPRSEREVRSALEREVEAERWTNLDRALRDGTDVGAGVVDLRRGVPGEDPDLRRLMIARAAKLERLGLAEPLAPACWALKPGLENTLRQLAIRGDIIKTMHQAMSRAGREPDVSGFALHGEHPAGPILGRLVTRGLDDDLTGSAYAIVDGVDGRPHHVRFADVEFTGDAMPGAIVEVRAYEDARGRKRLSLATRSDLPIEAQVTANGATWLDRQLLAREPTASGGGFGAEVRDAIERRIDHLATEGLARRQGQRVVFARDLLATLRRRDLDTAAAKLGDEIGLPYRPSGEGDYVAGTYRQRVVLASGRFAMIDDGLGFQLVPWRPALEERLGQHVSGVMMPSSGVAWSFARKVDLGI
jgi:type IV secretory pathway VirD2 relaxase